jgi:hypothetical protein
MGSSWANAGSNPHVSTRLGSTPQPHEAGGSSWLAPRMLVHLPGYQPDWDQPPQPHEAGGSGWQSAGSTNDWEQGRLFHLTTSSSSGTPTSRAQRSSSGRRRNDLAGLTSRVNSLDVRTSDIQNTLNTHIEGFTSFAQNAYTQFNNINTTLQNINRTYGLLMLIHYGRVEIPRVPQDSPSAKYRALGEETLPRVLHSGKKCTRGRGSSPSA